MSKENVPKIVYGLAYLDEDEAKDDIFDRRIPRDILSQFCDGYFSYEHGFIIGLEFTPDELYFERERVLQMITELDKYYPMAKFFHFIWTF